MRDAGLHFTTTMTRELPAPPARSFRQDTWQKSRPRLKREPLSAFVAPAMDSWEALGQAWDVINGLGCTFAGDVLVAGEHAWFR